MIPLGPSDAPDLSIAAVSSGGRAARARRLLIGGVVAAWLCCVAILLAVAIWPAIPEIALRAAAAHLPGHWQIDARTGAILTGRIIDRGLLLAVGVLPILLIEAWLVGYTASSIRRLTVGRSISGTYDLGIFALTVFGLWRFWTIIGTLGAGYLLGWLGNYLVELTTGHHLQIDTGSVAANIVLYCIAFTFVDYWNHRLFHCRPFWFLHRMHHSATEMTVISLMRNHPGVAIIEPLTRLWPLTFFAAPPLYVVCFVYAVTAYEFLIHSGVRWSWGWFGRWILLPPLSHHMHHSTDHDLVGKMLGIVPIWDRLFGTWCDLDPEILPLGVTDASYNSRHFLRETWRDLGDFGASVRDIAVRRPQTRPAREGAPFAEISGPTTR